MGNEQTKPSDDDGPLPQQRIVRISDDGSLVETTPNGGGANLPEISAHTQAKAQAYRPPFVLKEAKFVKESDKQWRFVCWIQKLSSRFAPQDVQIRFWVLPRLLNVLESEVGRQTSSWPILEKDPSAAFGKEFVYLVPEMGRSAYSGPSSSRLNVRDSDSDHATATATTRSSTDRLNPLYATATTRSSTGTGNGSSTGGSADEMVFTVPNATGYLNLREWSPNLFVADAVKFRYSLAVEIRPKIPLPTTTTPADISLPPEGSLLHLFTISSSQLQPQLAERFLVGPSSQVFHVQELFGSEEDGDCVICLTDERNTTILPCRHLCLCAECATNLQMRLLSAAQGRAPELVRCPLCRQSVGSFVQLDGRKLVNNKQESGATGAPGTAERKLVIPAPAEEPAQRSMREQIGSFMAGPLPGTERTDGLPGPRNPFPWISDPDAAAVDIRDMNPLYDGRRGGAVGSSTGGGSRSSSGAAGARPGPVEMAGGPSSREGAGPAATAPAAVGPAENSQPAQSSRGIASSSPPGSPNRNRPSMRPDNVDPQPPPPGGSSSSSSGGAGGAKPLPARALRRISAELRAAERDSQRLLDEGLVITPVPAANLPADCTCPQKYASVKLLTEKIDKANTLGRVLRDWKVANIELELFFSDHFPMEPPKVRPCFNNGSFWVQSNGALCMEILTIDGWSPATSLEQLALHIRAMMMQSSGSIYAVEYPYDREAAWKTSMDIEHAHKGGQGYGQMNQ